MAFVRENGSLNMKPCPVIQSEVMELFGFEMNGKFQARDHVAVFPQEFFGPVAPGNCYGRITGYSHSIHHYAASWLDTNEISKAQITRERIKKIKEHNRLRKFNANRSCHNLKNKIKKFQIWNCISDTNTAGSKAPADIRQISEYKGYQAIEIHSHSGCEGDWTYKRLTQEWDKCYELISNDSILLLQHPFWQEQRERNDTLLRLKEMKHVKVISLVHDVEELRGIFLSAYRRDEFKFMLQIADVLIVHNEKMKNYFINSGVKEERIVSLEIFDYLSDVKQKNPPEFEKSITIAGNLDAVKSRYLEKLNELAPLTVHLYGPNCTFVNADRMDASNIIYHGVVPSDALSRQLNCGFGLVWDGDSLDTCSGITGEYLKYNNPHKLSLYLSSGLPVIIWKEAAEAEFVLKNGVGIAVNSLYELREVIQNMNRKQYQQYVSSVEKIAFDIRKGKHTELAIERAESILKNVIM